MEASLRKASDVVATLLNRRPGGGGGYIEPPREPELPRDWPEQLPFRKRPKPYSRAIAWTPGDSKTRPDRKRPYELFVSQSVLRQVRGHLITARSGEPYGFLLGQVVYCPWSETPYLVIDAVRRESQNLPPANDMDRFRHAWVAATRDARHRRGEVIGWYHRHGVLGLRLSEWDLHLQEEFFPEAWHCALIIASTSQGIIGGFIQRSPRARLFRKGLAAFHELVDLDAKLVDGRKPSFVDWQNYGAGEPVSVLKAKWPAPKTRLERWKSPDHASEGETPAAESEPPTAGTGRSPTPRPATGSRGLRGRSWRKDPAPSKGRDRRTPRETDFSEEEFTGVVGRPKAEDPEIASGPPGPATAGDGPEARPSAPPPASDADADPAAATGASSEPKPAEGEDTEKERKAAAAELRSGGAAPADTEAPGAADTEAPGAADAAAAPAESAWYRADFAEAVWGKLPFALEDPEPSNEDEEAAARASGRYAPRGGGRPRGTDAGASRPKAAKPRSGPTPRFELVPPFETEPAEGAEEGSVAWLVSSIGETLSRTRATDEVEGTPDAGTAAAAEGAGDGSGERSARTRPALATPPAKRRKTFVSASQNPEIDREAEIPVVLFHDRQPWRPSPRLLRIAATLAILALGALALRAIVSRGPAFPPPAPAAGPASLTDGGRPTPEFVDLADTYLSGLQDYRERLVQHGLGRADCERLTEDFSAVVLSHRALARYVAATPSMADRFARLDAEIGPARQRFAASGCPMPAELAPNPASDDPVAPLPSTS